MPHTTPIAPATASASANCTRLGFSPASPHALYAPTRNSTPCARLSTSIMPKISDSPTARMNRSDPIARPLSRLMKCVSSQAGMSSGVGRRARRSGDRRELAEVGDHGVDVARPALLDLAQVELLLGRLPVEAPRAARAVVD